MQFGGEKCKKMHIGNSTKEYKCQDLSVDKWAEVEIENEETGYLEKKDIFAGEHLMEEKSEEKYLGDIISTDGKKY